MIMLIYGETIAFGYSEGMILKTHKGFLLDGWPCRD